MENTDKTPENDIIPQVSIVIPVYNNFELTKKCIDSIRAAKLKTSYEIIIADDGSTDETVNIEKYYDNIRLVRAPKNQGALLNEQNAVPQAKGAYVFLMNNDMVVKPEFLDYLYATISADEQIGIAGAMMLNGDDTIQEAGATVYSDGTTEWNYFKRKKINTNKTYEVDYCSSCGILFAKEDWDKVGGLDERYSPAYYEDVDFCYKIRYELGKKIICQPKAQIYHLCNQTFKEEVCALCDKNRVKFLDKWGDKLYKKRSVRYNGFWERIFSLKNFRKHKVITILGIKIKLKR